MSPFLTTLLAVAGGWVLRHLGLGSSLLPSLAGAATAAKSAAPVSVPGAAGPVAPVAPSAPVVVPASGHPSLADFLMSKLAGVITSHVEELIDTTLQQAVKPPVPAIPVTPAPAAPSLAPAPSAANAAHAA